MSKNFTEFGGGVWIGNLASDPVSGRAGEFYFNTVFKKFRGFDGTMWANVGSGAGGGGINFGVLDSSYLPNSTSDYDFEIGVGTWAAYQNTAQAVPVNMQGGTPMIGTGTTTTSGEVLDGQQSYKVAKGGSNQQGSGVSKLFYIPPGWRGMNMNLSFVFKVIGGTSITFGDLAVFGYDVSNGVIITPPANLIVPGSTQLNYNVYIPANCAQVYFGIHFATNVTYDIQYSMDDVALAPFTNFETPTADDMIEYTPTFTGFGTPSDIEVYSCRRGSNLYVQGFVNSGTPDGSTASMTLGYKGVDQSVQLDPTKLPGTNPMIVGYLCQAAGTARSFSVIAVGTTPGVVNFGVQDASNSSINPTTGNNIVSSNFPFSFFFEVPIAGWSTNLPSIGSKHFRMSQILSGGTRVTGTAPTSLGQYRSYLRDASALTLNETNGAPADPFSPINGMPLYVGGPGGSADGSNAPTAFDVFVGFNKTVKFEFFLNAGRSDPLNVSPWFYSPSSTDLGYCHGYDPSTGLVTIRRSIIDVASTGHTPGMDAISGGPVSGGPGGGLLYWDIIVADNLFALQLGLKESWSGYIDDAASWSTSSGSYVDPTLSGTVNFFTRKNNNFGTVTAASSSKPGFIFTPSDPAAVYLVTATAVLATGGTAGSGKLWDGTNDIATAGAASAAAGGNSTPFIGVYAPGTTSPVELSIQLQSAGSGIVIGNQTGAVFNAVEFTVTRIA